ncbi:transporter substrate-binding domain-containing protein [bacterium]|nr:MAG: transporter substrate-binding domain-containing protein [bacterium]
MFKKLQVFILLFLIGVTQAYSQKTYSGDTWKDVKEKGEGNIVLTYVETPAFVFKDANGKLQGICVDIVNSFISYVQNNYKVKLNVKYEGDGSNFKNFYESVKGSKGGVIGLGNVTIKEQRRKEVAFSPAYIKSIALLVTHSSAPDIADPSEMRTKWAGFTAYVPKGTTHEQRMISLKERYFPELKIEYTSSSFESFDKMLDDKKAICFQDIALYWDYKQKSKPVKTVNYEKDSGEELALIMPLGSDWEPLFDEFFSVGAGFKSSTIYRSSLMRHLGKEVVQMLKMAQ